MTGYQITANDLSGFKRHNTGARAKARYEAYQREAASKKLTPADKLARISALNRTEPICNLTKKHKLAEKNSGKKSFFGEKFIKVEYVKGNFPAASVLMTLMFACVLAVIVYSSVQYAAAKNQYNDFRDGLAVSNTELSELISAKDARMDLEEVERIAVEEYGMIRKDKAECVFVSVNKEDTVVISETEKAAEGQASLLSAFAERLRSVWEYFN